MFIIHTFLVFNGVVQLCIMHLPDAFKRFLKLDTESHVEAHKSKRFIKVRNILKSYLADLIKVCIGKFYFYYYNLT